MISTQKQTSGCPPRYVSTSQYGVTKHESSSWLLWVLGLCPPVWRVTCVEINQCVGCRIASMAWRSTRRFSTANCILHSMRRLQVGAVRLGHRRAASLRLLEQLLLFSFRFRLFEGAILLGQPVWKSKSHVASPSMLPPDALIDFHTAANFSSWARFLASAARFLSFLVYLPASHSVASTASDKESRTRESRDKSPGSVKRRGRWDRIPPRRACAAVRAFFSRGL